MDIIYDNSFNQNEWFSIIMFAIGIPLVFISKKKLPIHHLIAYYLYSVFIAIILDHTIANTTIDFYDVNDTSNYDFFDFVTYFMYGTYSCFFIYILARFNIKTKWAPLYVLLWSCFSMVSEFIGTKLGVYHYKNGYRIGYSFPIYLITLSLQFYLYILLSSNEELSNESN